VQSEWRLLLSGSGTGAYNMAVDEVLLNGVIAGKAPPTIRFYTWKQECLSFGFLQEVDKHLRNKCKNHGVEMVRRPTGGYALLHGRDFCYSIATPFALLSTISHLEASRSVVSALATGLCFLNIPVAIALDESKEKMVSKNISCVASVSLYDIMLNRKKIVGSASLCRQDSYLQHGSIFVDFSEDRIDQLLKRQDLDYNSGNNRSSGLRQIMGIVYSGEKLIAALAEGFRKQLKVKLKPAALEFTEENAVRKLVFEKYAQLDYRKQQGRLSQQDV